MLRLFDGVFNGFRLDIADDSDGVRIEGRNTSLENFSIINTFEGFRDHNDLIQIVPSSSATNYHGPVLESLFLNRGVLKASGRVHGITCFDALLKHVEISDCYVSTRSDHTITLRGLVSGKFQNLSLRILDEKGFTTLGRLKLYPLRLGGGDGINEIKIMSFKDFEYEKIESDGSFILEDFRFDYISNFNCSYLIDFDLEAFHTEVMRITDQNKLSLSDGSLLKFVKKFGKIKLE